MQRITKAFMDIGRQPPGGASSFQETGRRVAQSRQQHRPEGKEGHSRSPRMRGIPMTSSRGSPCEQGTRHGVRLHVPPGTPCPIADFQAGGKQQDTLTVGPMAGKITASGLVANRVTVLMGGTLWETC